MRFSYERYVIDSTGGGVMEVHRPEILVRVIGKKDDAFLLGLLDTGADEVLVPRSVAETIGLETNAQPWKIAGVGGQTLAAFPAKAEFELIDGDQSLRWSAQVAVVDYKDPGEQPLILGRNGFLQFFDAEFLGAEFEIDLKPNGTFPALLNVPRP